MNLSCLLSVIEQNADYQKLVKALAKPSGAEHKLVISDAAKSYLIAALYQKLKLPVLVVTAQPENARRLYDELQLWCPSTALLHFFPDIDFLAGESSSADSGAVTERLQALSTLTHYRSQSQTTASP